MVSFNERPVVHLIPFYRPSTYETLFWKPDDFAEFKRDAQLEKEEQYEYEQQQQQQQLSFQQAEETPETFNGQQRPSGFVSVRGYDRPDDWLSTQPRRGNIGYAKVIKIVRKEKEESKVPLTPSKISAGSKCKIRGYDRPDDWLPLQAQPGNIGYATTIRAIREGHQQS
jgi:hypothetical protein